MGLLGRCFLAVQAASIVLGFCLYSVVSLSLAESQLRTMANE